MCRINIDIWFLSMTSSSPRGAIKCFNCGKSVYPMELVSVGSNNYHKLCFKCSSCGVPLTLKNAQEKGGLVYCPQHVPKETSTATADRHDLNTNKDKPKVGVLNEQVRGELAGQKPNIDLTSGSLKNAMNAPKVGVINEQVRGELAGQKPNMDLESGALKNAMAAPKVGVVNEQVRGELAGQKPNMDLESGAFKNAMNVPKVGVVNEQVRGELAGQKSNLDLESGALKNAMAAPKVGVVNEQIRGELAGQKPNIDVDSAHIKSALDAPKTDANLQIKKTNVELAKGDAYHV